MIVRRKNILRQKNENLLALEVSQFFIKRNLMSMWIWGRLAAGLAYVIPPLETYLHQRTEMLWSEWSDLEEKRLCQYGLKEE